MNPEQITKKLDTLYENKKARNFFNHLVRAYIPIDKINVVKNKPNKPFNCVITDYTLISHNEILIGVHSKELDRELLEQLKTMFSATTNSGHPTTASIGGKFIGVTTKDTTTNMGYNTYQVFYDWVVTKMLLGDKHINWLLKDIDRSEFMDRAKSINNTELQNKLNKVNLTTPSQATYTLGDLDVLRELKDKMENK